MFRCKQSFKFQKKMSSQNYFREGLFCLFRSAVNDLAGIELWSLRIQLRFSFLLLFGVLNGTIINKTLRKSIREFLFVLELRTAAYKSNQTWLQSALILATTSFGRCPKFHCSTTKTKHSSYFLIKKLHFHFWEDLNKKRHHSQVLRLALLRMY